jgi:hypothetical protein
MTKSHLAHQLSQVSTLSIQKFCSTRSDPEAPANYPYWTCNNSKIEKDWLKGWNAAQMEHSLRGVGKFDVALLRKDKPATEALVAAVEVLASSPMTESKLAQLKKRNMPWVEVQASVDFFRNVNDPSKPNPAFHSHQARTRTANPPSLSAWTHDKPLKVVGTSDGPWKCPVCEEMAKMKPETLKFTRIAAIVDVYSSSATNRGQGQVKRKVFGIFEQTRPAVWSQPDVKAQTHQFLVVGTSLSTTKTLSVETLPLDSKLLYSTHKLDKDGSWPDPPMEELKRQMEFHLQKERLKDAGALVDHRLAWPGDTVSDFFRKADKMAQLVSIQGIKSIGKLQASLTRLVGYRYRFDTESQSWVPGRNFKQQSL